MGLAWIVAFLVPILSGFFFISLNYSRRLRYSRSSNSQYILALLGWGIAITAVAIYFSAPLCGQLTHVLELMGFHKDGGLCADLQFLLPATNLGAEGLKMPQASLVRFDATALLAALVALFLAYALNFVTLLNRMLQSVRGLFNGLELAHGLFVGGIFVGVIWLIGVLYERTGVEFLSETVNWITHKKTIAFTVVAAIMFLRNPMKRAAKAKYIIDYGNGSEFLLFKASSLDKLVQITLQGGKVYIGRPIDPISPSSVDPEFIKIVPYLSGYRTAERKEVEIVTDYTRLAKSLELKDIAGNEMMFTLNIKIAQEDLSLLPEAMRTSDKIDIADMIYAIKMSEVESITIWDEKVYALLNVRRDADPKTG